MHDYKTLLRRAGAVLFWLAVWQAAAMAIGQEVFLVSPHPAGLWAGRGVQRVAGRSG